MTISLDRPRATTEERELRAALTGQAASLVPTLTANASQTEEKRRIADENIAAAGHGAVAALTPSGSWSASR